MLVLYIQEALYQGYLYICQLLMQNWFFKHQSFLHHGYVLLGTYITRLYIYEHV